MKASVFLIFLSLLFTSRIVMAGPHRNHENLFASDVTPVRTQTYFTSRLSRLEMDAILNQEPMNGRALPAHQKFGNIVAYMVRVGSPGPREPWLTLTEKRYSYMRDLISHLSSREGWVAYDLKLDDGSYVFHRMEKDIIFVVRGRDGAFMRGKLSSFPKTSQMKYEDLNWLEPPKRWDIPGVPELPPLVCSRPERYLRQLAGATD